jgi:hypothetical protein
MVEVLEAASPQALQPSDQEITYIFADLSVLMDLDNIGPERSGSQSSTSSDEPSMSALTPSQSLPTEGAPSISTNPGAAGSTTNEDEDKTKLSEEGQRAFTKAKREEMMRQMAADIGRHSLEREREFGHEHGYRLY